MADGDQKGELEDLPAITALGSLFKLTEINFWVDLYTGIPYNSTSLECTKTSKDDVISQSRTDSSSLSVETELSRQMNELGLPLSFCTNKERRNGKVKGKRKDTHNKILHTHEETLDEASNPIEVNECKISSSDIDQVCDSLNMHVDENLENQNDGMIEQRLEDDLVANQNIVSSDECGDWMTYWDDFYERNYYYNIRTHESTWEPPEGMEPFASVYESNELKEMVSKMDDSKEENLYCSDVISEEINNEHVLEVEIDKSTNGSFLFDLDPSCRPSTTLSDDTYDGGLTPHTLSNLDTTDLQIVPIKRKKKSKRKKAHKRSSADNKELEFGDLIEEYSPLINKYWCQRYLLFSKYDEGIKMDEEGWFSATPECIAKHHALRSGKGVIIDCFTGVGGNAIRFAQNGSHVVAIDIDPKKIEYAKHNASIYGVKDLIEFITADSFILAQNLKADTVFLSPPWGGPEYAKAKYFDIITMLKPHSGQFLFNVAKQMAPRIVMFLPRNVDINQLAELSLSANPPWKLEVEKNFLNGKLKAITAYFTDPSLCDTSPGS